MKSLRTAKALYSLAALVRDPDRLADVFAMSDALATREHLEPIAETIAKDPLGAKSLEERARLDFDLDTLRAMPEGTLGRAFADHLLENGLDPKAIPSLPSDDRLTFLRAHLYETHDVWHAVTGFGTDWKSEIGLQAFYLAQIQGSLPAALLAVGCLRIAAYEPRATIELFEAITRGWNMGRSSRPLFGVRWEELWSLPLADVRETLGLSLAA